MVGEEYQLFRRLGLGCGEYLLHRTLFRELASVYDGNMGADFLHHRHLMGDDHNGNAVFFIDFPQELQDGFCGRGIQCTGRLVAEQNLRLCR